MNLRITWLVPLMLLLTVSGCSAEDDLCVVGNRVSVVRAELRLALVEDMRKEGIPFSESESGEICYPRDKADFVRGRLIALDSQQRPSSHITIVGGDFARRVLLRLDEAGIEYTHSEVEGNVVLVVDQKDVERIREVSYGVAKEVTGTQK